MRFSGPGPRAWPPGPTLQYRSFRSVRFDIVVYLASTLTGVTFANHWTSRHSGLQVGAAHTPANLTSRSKFTVGYRLPFTALCQITTSAVPAGPSPAQPLPTNYPRDRSRSTRP